MKVIKNTYLKKSPLRAVMVVTLALGLSVLGGCSNMSSTEQRVVSGGAIGAGVGAVGTAVTGGCVTCGAAVGAAVGAGAGYVIDQSKKNK